MAGGQDRFIPESELQPQRAEHPPGDQEEHDTRQTSSYVSVHKALSHASSQGTHATLMERKKKNTDATCGLDPDSESHNSESPIFYRPLPSNTQVCMDTGLPVHSSNV